MSRRTPLMKAKWDALGRYRVLQEAEALGSIALVCHRQRITKTTFFRWRKRHAACGLIGLENHPVPPSPGRPRRMTIARQQALLDHVRKFPAEGCVSLSRRLAEADLKVSSPTIQKALIEWGLGASKARVAWVQAGCPPVQVSAPIPVEVPRSQGALEAAKAYFFRGIPAYLNGAVEIPRPSLEQVATATGIEIGRLRQTAQRDLWEESRARYRLRIEGIESEEWMRKAHVRADATTISSTARAVRLIGKKLQSSDFQSSVELARAVIALRKIYGILKKALGGDLYILSTAGQMAVSLDFPQGLPLSQCPPTRNTRGSGMRIEPARKAFFLGLPGKGSAPPISKPSVRQIAQHFELPVRYLQSVAMGQGWAVARREADQWRPEHRSARIVNQFGADIFCRLVLYIDTLALVILQRIGQDFDTWKDPEISDVCRHASTLQNSQKLIDEIFLGKHEMNGLVVPKNWLKDHSDRTR